MEDNKKGPRFNVFSKLIKMELSKVNLCEDGTPEENRVSSFLSNPKFPAHMSGLSSDLFYKCSGKKMRFGAGTYEEYSQFKKHLSMVAGFEKIEDLLKSGGPVYFIELINFSNEEGTIGPIICKKLHNDFMDNYNVAEKYFSNLDDHEKFWTHYKNWCKALFVASHNGAIMID